MPHFRALSLFLGSFAAVLSAQAGGTSADRQEFKQSRTYPYVFRPVCYLATQGPVPLRFAASGPVCNDRRPPKLPAAPKPDPKPEASAAVVPTPTPAPITETAQTSPNPAPAFPPPTNAPAPKSPTVDFSQFPPELVEAFRKQRDAGDSRNYLFDPIFQPALPDDLPKSSATYRQK